jgi:hyperosmotically inducible protein
MKQSLLVLVAGFAALLSGPVHAADQSAGQVIDDSSITTQVKAGLLDNKGTKSLSINVESYKGTVQLSGFVASEAEKATAGKVAEGVKGVTRVVNSVAVAPGTSVGTKIDDSITTSKVKAALMDSAEVKSMSINVETRGGVSQLAGFVDNAAMRDKAGRVAAGVSGVKRVDNQLQVKF